MFLQLGLQHAVNYRDRSTGDSVLMTAVRQQQREDNDIFKNSSPNNAKIVSLLIEYGADVNVVDDSGISPLHILTKNNGFEMSEQIYAIINYLIKAGADLDVQDQDGHTPLIKAIRDLATSSHGTNEYALIWDLLNNGANVKMRDNKGNTALGHLIEEWEGENRHSCLKIVKKLVEEYGADVNNETNSGQTPLMIAVLVQRLNIANYLLGRGANVNVEDVEGDTVLVYAATMGFKALARKMIKMTVDNKQVKKAGLRIEELIEDKENMNFRRDFCPFLPDLQKFHKAHTIAVMRGNIGRRRHTYGEWYKKIYKYGLGSSSEDNSESDYDD